MVVGDVKLDSNSNTKKGYKGETIWIGKCKWKKVTTSENPTQVPLVLKTKKHKVNELP
jgi:hypothetical protein